MIDLARLGLEIDSRQIKEGVGELDKLTAAGARAEGSVNRLGNEAAKSAGQVKSASAAAATYAANAQRMGTLSIASGTSVATLGKATGLAAYQAQNLAFQLNDVATGLASGQAPMRVLAQQSGQFYQIMQQSGLGVRGFAVELLKMIGILKVTQDAELAEEAANASAAAAAVRSAAQRSAAAIAAADTELALAQAAVRTATTSEALKIAQARVAAAHQAVAAAAGEATVAENALTVAMEREAAAATAAAAATTVTLGPMAAVLAGLAIAAGGVALGFQAMKKSVSDSGVLEGYARSLGLTAEQLEELRKKTNDFSLTFGDVWNGVKKTISDALDASPAWQRFKDGNESAFKAALDHAADFAARAYGYVVGAYDTIVQTWKGLPAAIGSAFVSAVNAAITQINALMKASIDGVNGFIDQANKLPLVNLGHLGTPEISAIKDSYADAGKKAGKSFAQNVAAETAFAQGQIAKGLSTLWNNIIGAAEERIADLAPKPSKAKKGSDHGLADALAQLDAQIKGQLRLAAAYQVSDAAAIKAEALQKAEEQAIRHKGQIGLFYEKELALAVAKGLADGSKRVADLNAQTGAQKRVNDMVAAGLIPAGQASEQLQLEASLRPLIARAELAQGSVKQRMLDLIKATAVAQKAANDEANRAQVLAATSSTNKEIDRLELETKLIGENNAVRAVAIARLEAEQYLKAHPMEDADAARAYIDAQTVLADRTANLAIQQDLYNQSLSYTSDLLALIDERAQTVASTLSSAFGSIGSGLGQAITAVSSYAAQQAKLDEAHRAAIKAGLSDEKEADKYRKASLNNQLAGTAQLIGGLKSMFKEHSVGYKAMEAAERAFAIIQAISTIKSVAAGAAKMFSQLGVWAFPAVGAMIAVMAGLGFSGGGSAKAPQSAEDVQAAQGTGTVLGDLTAKSESITKSLELTAANTNKMLEYDNAQLRSLRAIETNIGALAAQVAKELQVGGAFDLTGKTGTTSNSGFLGLFGSTTTKSLFDQGVQFNSTTLADAIANGISGSTYQIIEKVKKSSGFFGIGGGTKTSYLTTTGALDPDLQRQVGLILGSLRDSVVEAARILGLDVSAALNTFQVEIGKISFKDMSADEIQKALEAVFSKVADQMAGFAVDGLEQFQKAGEGLFETLQRLAKDYTTIDVALKSIGKTFGAVGAASIAARESLIALFGSLQDFVDQTAFYQQNFLTPAEQITPIQQSVNAELARLGLSSVDTIAEFKAVVDGLDLTTTAGQQLYASLMALAPAFYQVEQYEQQQADAAAQLAKQRANLEIQLLQAQGKTAEALAKQREMELAALDPSLRTLQQQIYAAQDAAAAKAKLDQQIADAKSKLTQAYQRERSELEATIHKFGDLSKSLREYRDTLFGEGSGSVTYNSALAKLIATGSLASTGDATALGDLQGVGRSFLDVAKSNAGSLQQYQRDVAMVARYVDQGIAAADGQMSVAEKQLAAMTDQVGKLVDINESVLSVKDAIIALNKLLKPAAAPKPPSSSAGGTAPVTAPGSGSSRDPGDPRNRDDDTFRDLLDTLRQVAASTTRTARLHERWDRGGSLAVATDDDTPLSTTSAS